MSNEYLATLKNISDRSGLFMAVNVLIIKLELADIPEVRVILGNLLKILF